MGGVADSHYSTPRLLGLGLLAVLILLPVTLPVPVLRELVQERFAVSELLTSLFMSINMVGAVLAAPFAGALADRFGHRPQLIAGALVADAICFSALTLDLPFTVFMGIRFLEGCAHIFSLSLLLGLAAESRGPEGRGLALGIAGSGLLLGVAIGAPLGGVIGNEDPERTFRAGAAIVLVAALLAGLLLRETGAETRQRPGLGEIVRLVRRHRLLLAPLLFAFADRFTVGFFTSTFSLFLRNVHELSPPQIGGLIATFMLPFALLSFPFGALSQRMSRAILLCGGSLIYGVFVASVGYWPKDALVVLMLLNGSAAAVMFVPSMLMTTELTPDEVRTTSMGAFNAAGSLGFIIGPLTGGLISQTVGAEAGARVGYQAAFLTAGGSEILLALVAFPILWRWERSHRR